MMWPIRKYATGSRWRRIAVASVLLMSAVGSANAQAPQFDGRDWTVGHQQRNSKQSLTEYVLPGQTVENWKELVTSQVFFQPVPVAALVEKLRESLAQGCPSLVWNVIEQTEKTVLYEWRDSGCGGFEPQHEVARVTIESSGLYRLAYAAKTKKPLSAERRHQWLSILSQVPLAEGPVRATAADAGASAGTAAAALNPVAIQRVRVTLQRSGLECPAVAKSDLKEQTMGPAGPLMHWLFTCSNGVQYSVLLDPFGGITAFPAAR
jgi:hypothetical protein